MFSSIPETRVAELTKVLQTFYGIEAELTDQQLRDCAALDAT